MFVRALYIVYGMQDLGHWALLMFLLSCCCIFCSSHNSYCGCAFAFQIARLRDPEPRSLAEGLLLRVS